MRIDPGITALVWWKQKLSGMHFFHTGPGQDLLLITKTLRQGQKEVFAAVMTSQSGIEIIKAATALRYDHRDGGQVHVHHLYSSSERWRQEWGRLNGILNWSFYVNFVSQCRRRSGIRHIKAIECVRRAFKHWVLAGKRDLVKSKLIYRAI